MKNLFLRLIRMLDDEVFYIGGADVLPAPLSAETGGVHSEKI